ncbi:MAG TPA: hypothetical protein DCE41_21490 [Cytophagales bacterium]|nr:hypothetical protein [Cytophagales bacterium]HAA19628.1 hypothetical protein [Cytophagales bacterium]
MMPWARLVKDLAPWNSTRGIIWQDGRRLTQVEDYDDVAKVPGSFWVDVDGKTLHLHAFGSENPSSSLIEVGVQSHLVRPQAIGMGYLQFRGITFEQCANGFLRTSTGAIWAKGGHHWIVEGNTIREINSSGLEFGYFAYEIEDTRPEAEWPRQDDDLGGMIIRNNEIHDCGTAGMRSFVLTDARVLNNHVYRCGWQDAENYWEVSGIKLLKTTRTLVAGNRVHDIQGGNGIWMDWDIQHSRVTRNIIYNVQCIQGGIFVEASQTPNLVDHNFLWNIDGNGIYANDSDNQLIHYNVVAHTTGPLVNSVVATERKLNGRWLTANHNTITHNLFIDGGAPVTYGGEGNVSDYNWLVTTRPPADFSVVAEQQAGRESHSVTSFSLVEFNPETLLFQWDVGGEVPQFALPADAPLAQQLGESVVPGPFHQLRPKGKLLLPEEF